MQRTAILLLLALVITSTQIQAQTVQDSVKAAVNRLFDGMKNADAALLKSAFADSAILQTIKVDKAGQTSVQTEAISEFINTIGTLPKGAADERIEFETIKTDGPLAMVWTPYQFYYKGKFSHCGVNSFQLVRLKGEWKIQYIIDTRRKDCNN